MDQVIKLGNTHEGRDKFCKAMQYFLKIVISSSKSKETVDWLTPTFSKKSFNFC